MSPAQAMGTFLRVWREEWAGLSREQVAIAVSALAPKAKVSKYVVREWEQGQPPHSATELQALELVMRVHGITPPEAEQVRQAVFDACSSQRYPELFEDESIAHREDVEELAYTLHRREAAAPCATSIVSLVAFQRELEAAVYGTESGVDGPQAGGRRLALAWVRSIMGHRHWKHAERPTQAARCFGDNADFLGAYFGRHGLPPDLSVLGQRSCEVYARLQAAQAAGQKEEVRRQARALAQVYERAWETQDHPAALHSLYIAVYPHELPREEALVLLREGNRRLLHKPNQGMPMAYRRVALCTASLHLGLLGEAGEHLAAIEWFRTAGPSEQTVWATLAGDWACRRTNYDEAQAQYERALETARKLGHWGGVLAAEKALAACDRARAGSSTTRTAK